MERALVAEDPKLASTLRGTTLRAHARRKALLGLIVFVIGIAVLMTGAVARQTIVGVVGFLLMLGSAYVALTAWRSQNHAGEEAVTPVREHHRFKVIDGGRKTRLGRSAKASAPRRPIMERFESRWRRRRDRGY
jgi:hypothetical protein